MCRRLDNDDGRGRMFVNDRRSLRSFVNDGSVSWLHDDLWLLRHTAGGGGYCQNGGEDESWLNVNVHVAPGSRVIPCEAQSPDLVRLFRIFVLRPMESVFGRRLAKGRLGTMSVRPPNTHAPSKSRKHYFCIRSSCPNLSRVGFTDRARSGFT